MKTILQAASTLIVSVGAIAGSSQALTVPFTEDFAADTAFWKNNGNGDLVYVASGGPDGGSYVTTPFAFASAFSEQVAIFRGQSNFNSSGNAFSGNWLVENVQRLTTYVRHDAPEALDFFMRVAPATPGATGVAFVHPQKVAPNAWTFLDFDVSFANPLRQNEGPNTLAYYENVLSQVGRVQIGMLVPLSQATNSVPVNYDLDQVSIVPEPSSVLLAVGVLLGGLAWHSVRSR